MWTHFQLKHKCRKSKQGSLNCRLPLPIPSFIYIFIAFIYYLAPVFCLPSPSDKAWKQLFHFSKVLNSLKKISLTLFRAYSSSTSLRYSTNVKWFISHMLKHGLFLKVRFSVIAYILQEFKILWLLFHFFIYPSYNNLLVVNLKKNYPIASCDCSSRFNPISIKSRNYCYYINSNSYSSYHDWVGSCSHMESFSTSLSKFLFVLQPRSLPHGGSSQKQIYKWQILEVML